MNIKKASIKKFLSFALCFMLIFGATYSSNSYAASKTKKVNYTVTFDGSNSLYASYCNATISSNGTYGSVKNLPIGLKGIGRTYSKTFSATVPATGKWSKTVKVTVKELYGKTFTKTITITNKNYKRVQKVYPKFNYVTSKMNGLK